MIYEQLITVFLGIHKDILVAGVEGSGAVSKQDAYSDLDITFLTTDCEKYLRDDKWLDYFGVRMIMQKPGPIDLINGHQIHPFLMVFKDGGRIDLKVGSVDALDAYLQWESSIQIIHDVHQLVLDAPTPTEESFYIQQPSEQQFTACVNEFFWLAPYVLKGIVRKQFMYVAKHLQWMREELIQIISWSIGEANHYAVNLGNAEKYLEDYMNSRDWNMLTMTYRMSNYDEQQESLLLLLELFDRYAPKLAVRLDYRYAHEDGVQVINYISTKIEAI
ncbi:aminoglycoside 6-adenylyltransferase [Kurthia sibirica]|nr:aminoglycoside 6-adenylyltransferase [Kurthia sibirica]GEK32621.1 aminoglycoside nucleotidyltransferase ANT(6)-Ia [Kurthia sibirica]